MRSIDKMRRSENMQDWITELKKNNMEDKNLICITNKYGNFTKDKIYPISVSMINAKTKIPAEFRIVDDEGDYFHVDINSIKGIFKLI